MSDDYQPVPVSAAREIAETFAKDIVIINAWDRKHALLNTTTFGKTPEDKMNAAFGGELAAAALGAQLKESTTHEDYRVTLGRRMAALLMTIAVEHGGWHTAHCPEDDTCACRYKPFNDAINRSIQQAIEAFGDVELQESDNWRDPS